jgi:CDP-diacylglycerol--glycerol-3-phosphate 3-phosphatidyltransferase
MKRQVIEKLAITPANAITMLRIVLIPLFLFLGTQHLPSALFIFAFSAWSDWLDGFVARKWHYETEIGAILDPIADKLTSWSAFWIIYQHLPQQWIATASLIIIVRDCMITYPRIQRLRNKKTQGGLKVSILGKIKTMILFSCQFLLLFYAYSQINLVYRIGSMLLCVSSLLTLISFGFYQTNKS